MRFTTIRGAGGREETTLRLPQGLVRVAAIREAMGEEPCGDLLKLIEDGGIGGIRDWLTTGPGRERAMRLAPVTAEAGIQLAPIYRRPRKIWGIGFNYLADEADRPEWEAEEPVGFLKPDTSLIGPGDEIVLPADIGRVQAEAELAIVIGAPCKNVSEAEAHRYVAGFAAAIDVTAADVHARNPRFLTRAKSCDTFCSLGAELLTPDEATELLGLTVTTALNGEAKHTGAVASMIYRPWHAVAFHARYMTLLPGDIILTGTPGAAAIAHGDRIECRIDGFAPLVNPVSDMAR